MTGTAPPGVNPTEVGRPRRRGVWIFLAIATALVVVAPVCFALWARAIRRTAEYTTPYHGAITELRLDVGSAEVSVGTGPDGEGRVYKQLRWAVKKPVVRESLRDGVLSITSSCPRTLKVYDGLECGAEIDVQVPAGVRVTGRSRSGEIAVRGVRGDLDLGTGSGEIRVADVSGRLRARARSGSIRGTGLASPEARVEVSSGELDLRYAEPPSLVDATAGAGSVTIIVPAGSHYRVEGWTGAGDAHLNRAVVDSRSDRVISVRSGSGSTYLDYRDD